MIQNGISIQICKFSLKKSMNDMRIIFIYIMTAVMIIFYTRDVKLFALSVDYPVHPWLFSILFENTSISLGLLKIFLLFGCVMLFCDAPFIWIMEPYFLIRAGWRSWHLGKCLYILSMSLIYLIFIYIISVIRFFPNISFSLKWGKVIGTLALTDLGSKNVLLLFFSEKVIVSLTPPAATLLTFMIAWLLFFLIGMTMFYFNSKPSTRFSGTALIIFLILLDPVVVFLQKARLYWISPFTWLSLSKLKIYTETNTPSIRQVITLLIILSTIVVQLSRARCRKKDFITIP